MDTTSISTTSNRNIGQRSIPQEALHLTLRLFIIVIAFISGIVFVYYILQPKVYDRLCLTNTKSAIKIQYQVSGNTALIYVTPFNNWYWYNDKTLYVYGEMTDRQCIDKDNFEVVYAISIPSGQPVGDTGYMCVRKIDQVISFYDKIDKQYMFYRPPGTFTMDIYTLINLLIKQRIIFE